MTFWQTKSLKDMTDAEWESLCDGCGKCCLHRMIDEDGDLLETNVACRLLDLETIRCSRYPERKRFVPDCAILDAETVPIYDWLPASCAYVRVAQGQDLPDWHHLKCGNRERMHAEGHSVLGRVIPEREAGPLDHHIIDWAQGTAP
ncbi:MAG: YcgN family cysteine cluster protein [Sphingomonadales bacterium]